MGRRLVATVTALFILLLLHPRELLAQTRKASAPTAEDQTADTRPLVIGLILVGGVVLIISVSQTLAARRRVGELEASFIKRIQEWISNEKGDIVTEQLTIARREASVLLADWKRVEEEGIRQDAIKRSQSVIVGKVTEHLVPFLPTFSWNPKDARFIGAPVDLVVFDGLDEGQLRSIVFVEVKTGSSVLTPREKQIREAVAARRIEWREVRIDAPSPHQLSPMASPRELPAPNSAPKRILK